MAEVLPLAPEYRYFTVDLLSNEIIGEIPFREVTWERAIKGAGSFSGKIPVIKETKNLNLYETTMPGKTALYVVRNNECVWGGIIWARQHDVITHNLSVSASEFTSYLYHRRIWKTWNHEYGGTVIITPDSIQTNRINYAKNTQGVNGNEGWGGRWFGASGTGTREYNLSSTPQNMPPGTKTFARKTWTNNVTIGGSGDSGYQVGGAIPVIPGETWTLSGWMRTNATDKVLGARAQLRLGNTIVNNAVQEPRTYVRGPNLWSLMQVTFTIPEGVDNFVPLMDGFSSMTGETPTGWSTGDNLDLTGVLIEKTDKVGTFFDGSTPTQGRYSYSWGIAGANADYSTQYMSVRAGGKVAFDYGSNATVLPGSSVHIEFYDPKDFKYNGYYRVSGDPAPTQNTFEIVSGQSISTVSTVQVKNNIAYIETATRHGFNTGDLITIETDYGYPFLGTYEIEAPDGPQSTNFNYKLVSTADIIRQTVIGDASRPVPDGVYTSATITVRADTYDYIRNLIEATFEDFVGTDFPNVYIEPGISYGIDITKCSLDGGMANIITTTPHGLAVGQAVQIKDLSPVFDGEFEIVRIDAPDQFYYKKSGTAAQVNVAPRTSSIVSASLINKVATCNTEFPHNYLVGQNVNVFLGYDYEDINGDWTIDSVPSPTSFTYTVFSPNSIPLKRFIDGVITSDSSGNTVVNSELTNNVVTLTTGEVHSFSVGDIVSVADVNRTIPLKEKAFDAPNSTATVKSSRDHGLVAGTATAPGMTNLVSNPRLATAATDWSHLATGGGGVSAGRAAVGSGVYAFGYRLLWTAVQSTPSYGTTIFNYASGKTPVTPGSSYFGRIAGSVTWSGALTRAAISWYNSGGTLISTTGGNASVHSGLSWRTVTGVAPAGAAFARIEFAHVGGTFPPNSAQMYATAALVVNSTVPVSYFDGSGATGDIGAVFGWTGTANASPSTKNWSNNVYIEGVRDTGKLVSKVASTASTTFTTNEGHNFRIGDQVTIENLSDVANISAKQLVSNVGTITTAIPHNRSVGDSVTIDGLVDNYAITNKMLSNNVATITTSGNNNIQVNDKVTVTKVIDTAVVVSKMAERGVAILTLSRPHNFAETEEIKISGVGAPFDGSFTVLAYTSTRVFYEITNENLILPSRSAGLVTGTNSIFNGTFTVSAQTANSFSFARAGEDIPSTAAGGNAGAASILNGYREVTGRTANTLQFAAPGFNMAASNVPVAKEEGDIQATVSAPSIHLGTRTLTGVSRNTITFNQSIPSAVTPMAVEGSVSVPSIFNGLRPVNTPTDDTFKFPLIAPNNVIEEASTTISTATAFNIFNGRYTVIGVDREARTVSYVRTWAKNLPSSTVQNRGKAVVRPTAVVSSFGPYPGNANIGFDFSTRRYSGINVEPVAYRGFELASVGDALDAYSDTIEGFEYRIDCAYDRDTSQFTRTFVLIPIDFPNPPAPGEVSPLSRFGAEKLVFEYPGGNIKEMQIEESAEDSATRFFAVGSTDLGPDAGPPMSIASAEDLLSGNNGIDDYRRWPLLDETEKIDDVDDEAVLYTYAKRYLNENRPPDAKLVVSVIGSIAPVVGTYSPGDWCSLIVDDDFIKMRLASDLEPRDDVIVRKIDSYKVTVPDGTTFPETVSLVLVPEWEVDKRGKSSV